MAERIPTYVIDGHGSEDMCEMTDRDVIPENTVLITFAECGNYVFLPDAIPRLESMAKTPEEWTSFTADMPLKDIKASLPKDPSRDLSRGARVYTPGMSYPKLSLTSLGSSSVTGEMQGPPPRARITVQRYWKSGVYKLPITLKDYSNEWLLRPSFGQTVPWYHDTTGFLATGPGYKDTYRSVKITPARNADVAAKMYEGALLPDPAAQKTIIEQHMAGKPETPIPLASIFEKLGPGVYYWMVCRAGTLDETTELKRAASNKQQQTARGGRRRRGRKTYRKKRRMSLKVARR
jgi:hypothetical protein